MSIIQHQYRTRSLIAESFARIRLLVILGSMLMDPAQAARVIALLRQRESHGLPQLPLLVLGHNHEEMLAGLGFNEQLVDDQEDDLDWCRVKRQSSPYDTALNAVEYFCETIDPSADIRTAKRQILLLAPPEESGNDFSLHEFGHPVGRHLNLQRIEETVFRAIEGADLRRWKCSKGCESDYALIEGGDIDVEGLWGVLFHFYAGPNEQSVIVAPPFAGHFNSLPAETRLAALTAVLQLADTGLTDEGEAMCPKCGRSLICLVEDK